MKERKRKGKEMSLLTDDDEGFMFEKVKQSNLRHLFDGGGATSSNSFNYYPPKTPPTTTTPQQQKTPPIVGRKSSLVCFVAAKVTVYRYEGNEAKQVGQLGAAVLGTPGNPAASQLLLYQSNQKPVVVAPIHPSFNFTIQQDLYGSFTDGKSVCYSIRFENKEEAFSFSKQIALLVFLVRGGQEIYSVDISVPANNGKPVRKGDTIGITYTGWLEEGSKIGDSFDSNVDKKTCFRMVIGNGDVIKGWDLGVKGMKKGGRRLLVVPSSLGYGTEGADRIPPNATLIFDIIVDRVKRAYCLEKGTKDQEGKKDEAQLKTKMTRLGQVATPGMSPTLSSNLELTDALKICEAKLKEAEKQNLELSEALKTCEEKNHSLCKEIESLRGGLVQAQKEEERKATIKCKFGDEAVRFELQKTTTLEELIGFLEEEWGVGKRVEFQDEEGDWVKMKRNNELLAVWEQTKTERVTLRIKQQQLQQQQQQQQQHPPSSAQRIAVLKAQIEIARLQQQHQQQQHQQQQHQQRSVSVVDMIKQMTELKSEIDSTQNKISTQQQQQPSITSLVEAEIGAASMSKKFQELVKETEKSLKSEGGSGLVAMDSVWKLEELKRELGELKEKTKQVEGERGLLLREKEKWKEEEEEEDLESLVNEDPEVKRKEQQLNRLIEEIKKEQCP